MISAAIRLIADNINGKLTVQRPAQYMKRVVMETNKNPRRKPGA
jgi:hypothetical protein